MPKNELYPPEGLTLPAAPSLSDLREAMASRTVLESTVLRCGPELTLHLRPGGFAAVMPREEVTAPWISGAERDIAVLSRVGKSVCFTVDAIREDGEAPPLLLLSRRKAQEAAMDTMREALHPGDVLTGRIVGLAPFGAFVDIGRGIAALLPTGSISAARVRYPKERFRMGQTVSVAVKSFDRDARRVILTHKELLGTWAENAAGFAVGDVVRGTVRGIMDYGCFVELAPNLSGLTDCRSDLQEGDAVSVMLRSIRPEKMKIKLQVIQRLTEPAEPEPFVYRYTDRLPPLWTYSPPEYEGTPLVTDFTAP